MMQPGIFNRELKTGANESSKLVKIARATKNQTTPVPAAPMNKAGSTLQRCIRSQVTSVLLLSHVLCLQMITHMSLHQE